MVDMVQYHKSLSEELNALKNRIRSLMDTPHWLTDGEWKESVLRSVLRRHLPSTVEVGRGFIFTPEKCSKQIDILIYDRSQPIIFRDGDLVFVTPDAVLGIIEVKSTATMEKVGEAIDSLKSSLKILWEYRDERTAIRMGVRNHFSGIFFYDTDTMEDQRVLSLLAEKASGQVRMAIHLISIGSSTFVRYWGHPVGRVSTRDVWHSYNLNQLAAAYFISNVVSFCSPLTVSLNQDTWFPLDSKETRRTGSIGLINDQMRSTQE